MTPIRSTVKSGVVTGKVPSDGGTYFLPARLPAMASMGMIIRNRPINMSNPIVVLYQSVLAFSPPKAEPLLPAPETYAYNICVNPCGPGLLMLSPEAIDRRHSSEHQNHQWEDERDQHRHLYVVSFDLLAEIFRCAADHQSGDEHRQHDVNQDAVHTGADAAEDHL